MEVSSNHRDMFFSTFSFLYAFTGKMLLLPLLPAIQQEFALTHTKGSLLWSAFLLVYAIVQLYVYRIIEKFGKKQTIFLATGAYAIILLVMGFSRMYEGLLLLQLVAAIPNGVFFIAGLSIVEDLKTDRNSATNLGTYISGSSLAYVIAPVVAGMALKTGGWRWAYRFWAVIGFIMVIALRRSCRDDVFPTPGKKNAVTTNSGVSSYYYVFAIPYLIVLAVLLLDSGRVSPQNTFFCSYLITDRGISEPLAATIYTFVQFGAIAGQFAGGIISSIMGSVNAVMGACAGTALLTYLLTVIRDVKLVIIESTVLGFVSGMSFPILLRLLLDLTPVEAKAQSTGIANALSFVFASVGSLFIGKIIDGFGFRQGFICLSGVAVISFLGILVGMKFCPQLKDIGAPTSLREMKVKPE